MPSGVRHRERSLAQKGLRSPFPGGRLPLSSKNAFMKFRTDQMMLRAGTKGMIGTNDEKGPGKPSTAHVDLDLPARMKDLIASTYQVFNF